jgi:hypothetical protein
MPVLFHRHRQERAASVDYDAPCPTPNELGVSQPHTFVIGRKLTPFIGRDKELGLLVRRWESVRAGPSEQTFLTCQSDHCVARDPCVVTNCWPRFDSAACFAALLGTPENGRWLIAPALAPLCVTRRYRPGTLVLETEFKTESGSAVILDFMPPADGAELVRIVVGRSGLLDFRTEYVARFDYGSTVGSSTRRDQEGGFCRPSCLPRRIVDSVNARGHCDTTVAL